MKEAYVPARTPKGARAIPSSRTKGIISRSADLSMMEYMVWKIAKGVFPVLRAYSLARATAHAGVLETPYRRMLMDHARVVYGSKNSTYEVENLASNNIGVESIDDLLDGGIPVPEVEVEDVDVVGLEVLQGRVYGVTQGLGAVAGVGRARDGVGGEVKVVGVLSKVVLGEYEMDIA